jgi:uncharacterized protein YebE (UPF0316 family)
MNIVQQLSDNTVFVWVIMPLLIFLSRVCDVTLGTIRIIFISRGNKMLAPIFGFIEVSIWVLAMSQIVQNLDNPIYFLAYGLGFSLGCFVGMVIEEKLAMGYLIVRIFLVNEDSELREQLYSAGFGVTTMDAHGMNGNVKIVFTVIKRKDLKRATDIIESCQSNAFYSIEDAKSVKQGVFSKDTRSFPALSKKKHYRRVGK